MPGISTVMIIKIVRYVLILILCILFFLSLMKTIPKAENLGPQAAKIVDKTLKERGVMNSYKMKLSKMGIAYRVGNYDLNPSWYIMARCAVGCIVVFVIYAITRKVTPIMLIGFVIGFIGLDFYYKKENDADNKDMIMDLYNTYANLKIQLNSGIYITDSLAYSYNVAHNKRYKEALGELILNMADKTIPMEKAIDIFKNRFDSREIDKLCAMLHNYAQYGANDSYTADIMSELNSIITASTLGAEHDIESKAGMVNFMFFVCIIALVGYSIISQLSGMKGIF